MTLTNIRQVQKNMTLRGDKGFYAVNSIERKSGIIIIVDCQTNKTHRVRFSAIKGMEVLKY